MTLLNQSSGATWEALTRSTRASSEGLRSRVMTSWLTTEWSHVSLFVHLLLVGQFGVSLLQIPFAFCLSCNVLFQRLQIQQCLNKITEPGSWWSARGRGWGNVLQFFGESLQSRAGEDSRTFDIRRMFVPAAHTRRESAWPSPVHVTTTKISRDQNTSQVEPPTSIRIQYNMLLMYTTACSSRRKVDWGSN